MIRQERAMNMQALTDAITQAMTEAQQDGYCLTVTMTLEPLKDESAEKVGFV